MYYPPFLLPFDSCIESDHDVVARALIVQEK